MATDITARGMAADAVEQTEEINADIESLTTEVNNHITNKDIHVTTDDKTKWNGYENTIGTLKKDLANEATTRAAADTALNSRIDNIASSATTDTEVIDARTDASGAVFSSLKARLDGENSEIKGSISELKDIFGIKNAPNMLNPDTLEKGKVINSEGNVVDGASNRSTSGLIKVDVSLPLKITTTGNQILCQYDSAGNSLVRTTEFSSTTPVTLENNAKYVRVCLWNSTISSAMLYQSEKTLSYIPYHVYSEKARDNANIYTTDTEEEIFNKLYNAYLIGNYDVYWEHGTYEFSTIFELLKTKYGRNTAYELPIGGNCRYFFNGSTLKATAVSEDSNVLGNESLLGSWRKNGSYELHDGFLESTGMVYVVHDESSGLSEPYVRRYKNIRMKYNTDTSKRPSGFCLGGGTGLNGYVEFDGCVFETNSNSTADGGYHGHSKDVASTFNVLVKNCYFSKAFQKGTLATNESANLVFTGSTALTIPSSSGRWNVTQWNNETHS